jgi:guanylate kinase
MLVLSSPSGAGKTAIALAISDIEEMPLSVSATTRPQRTGEREGKHYYFVSHERFDEMAAGGELLEHATVFGNAYGTPRAPVVEALELGTDVLFDVDWQGARDLAAAMPENVVRVFILPPSMAELERRLRGRAQDSDSVVAERMRLAAEQMSHWPEYDYVIVNDVLDESVANVRAILKAERLRRTRRDEGLARFVRSLGEAS